MKKISLLKIEILRGNAYLKAWKLDPLGKLSPTPFGDNIFVVEQNRTKSFEDEAMSLVLFVHS